MKNILYVEANYDRAVNRFYDLLNELDDKVLKWSRMYLIIETEDFKFIIKNANSPKESYCGLKFNKCFIDEYGTSDDLKELILSRMR